MKAGELSFLPVAVNDVFPETAWFAESSMTVLTHDVVDVTSHVVLEYRFRGILLLAVGALEHDVVQDKATLLSSLSPMMI